MLVDALGRVAAALEKGDALAAGAASDSLGKVLEALNGARLPGSTLAEARALLALCEDRAARVNAQLRASLLQTSTQRRAADSYAQSGGKATP